MPVILLIIILFIIFYFYKKRADDGKLTTKSLVPVTKRYIKTLCILVIIGSVLGILRGCLFWAAAQTPGPNFRGLGVLHGEYIALTSLGTLIGAIFMLKQKKFGLYVYSGFQITYLFVVFWINYEFWHDSFHSFDHPFFYSALFIIIISLGFLISFWSKSIRQELN